MRGDLTRCAIVLLATTATVAAAQAQTTQCVNDAPNPYHMVNDWATRRVPWAQTNTSSSIPRTTCGCSTAARTAAAPIDGRAIWELVARRQGDEGISAPGTCFPHAVVPDKDGNIWIVDGQAKDGIGNQVVKLHRTAGKCC